MALKLFHLNFAHPAWRSLPNDCGYCRGSAYIRGTKVDGESLLRELPGADQSTEVWKSAAGELNGFFAVIKNTQDAVVAAVDRVRSIPLFYGIREQILYLSDDAEWVRRQIGDKQIDPVTGQEFLMAGFVTGQDTLYPNLKQLQAGEILRAKLVAGRLCISTHRYFRFTYSEPVTQDDDELRSLIEGATERSIRRLTAYAAGRQIVLPLSGGYDSRLIALMLKRLQYEKVVAFTYGVSDNRESKYSQRIATEFGFPWRFIEYTPEKWRSAWQSDSCYEYRLHGSGWSAIPHLQDWLAVRELADQGLVQRDCIFVPGHGAMSIFQHLKGLPETESGSSLLKQIFRRKYDLSPATVEQKRIVYDRLRTILKMEGFANATDLIAAFSTFEWQERQCKFLNNSVRVYEHFNYDWWLPLWDAEFIDFWEHAPLKIRKDRAWYENYCRDVFNSQTLKPNLTNPSRRSLRSLIGGSLYSGPTRRLFQIMRGAATAKLINTHPFHAYSRYPPKTTESLIKKGYSLNGIGALLFLQEFTPYADKS